ncbi:MAG: SDR family oxidoreductase [Pirellulales bacterium]
MAACSNIEQIETLAVIHQSLKLFSLPIQVVKVSSPAILLTGATGLLGRFILRRLLESGHDVAAIVRAGSMAAAAGTSSEGQTAANQVQQLGRRRIEQVLQPFESNRLLPRPRVFVWDFASNDLPPPFASNTTNSPVSPQQNFAPVALAKKTGNGLLTVQLRSFTVQPAFDFKRTFTVANRTEPMFRAPKI